MLRLVFAAILLSVSSSAHADTIEDKAQICSGCHGEKGIPQEKTTPIIWGQNVGYLYLQLRDLQKGARKNEIMTAIAADISKEDALALAEYFSAKAWPNLAQPSASKEDVAIAIRVNGSVGCTGCHLDHYQGDSSVPRTNGQQHDYVLKTMLDFRSGARANNPGMTDLMNAASEDELKAVANYLAGL
eukprot:gene19499-19927_t